MAAIIGWLALSFAVSFLLGSIPWGVIVSKLAYHKDIRDEGSGNIGTTNAFRAMGKVGGALVFVLDFGKGLLSGWLAFWFWAPLAGWAEIDYSLAGATLPATVEGLPVDAGALALAALGIAVTRCVSVGSIAAAVICPVLALYFYWGQWVPWLIIAATACVVIWAHRANIARLRAGTENKIGSKKTA